MNDNDLDYSFSELVDKYKYISKLTSDGSSLFNINYSDFLDAIRTTDSTELDEFFENIDHYINSHSPEAGILYDFGLFRIMHEPELDIYEIIVMPNLRKITVFPVKFADVELERVDIRIDGKTVESRDNMHSAVVSFKIHLCKFLDEVIKSPKAQVLLAVDEINEFIEEENFNEIYITYSSELNSFNIRQCYDNNAIAILLEENNELIENYPFKLIKCDFSNGVSEIRVDNYSNIVNLFISEIINLLNN